MTLNDLSSPLAALATRRSGKPRDLVGPGPDADQLARMVQVAARTPDHGKLAPWRFVTVAQDRRDDFARLLAHARTVEPTPATQPQLDADAQFAHQAPALVVQLFSPRVDSPVPAWEQELSAGAAGMNLLHAAHAMGFAGGWLTTWAAYSPVVRDAFGAAPERIAGFFFFGTPARAPDERPRPDMARVATAWDPPSWT